MTRGRKRKVGQRDVWDLLVNNDDITFKHILPKLNSTDLKFLHLVNSEARKLMKRSSRTWELKKSFKVEEMSSISTLEVAWENKSLWPYSWNKTDFCREVAETNKLELLKRINSSCSSGYERRKNVSGINKRFMWPQFVVIWKW